MVNGRKQGCYNFFCTFCKHEKSITFLQTNRITLTLAFSQTLCCLLQSPLGRLSYTFCVSDLDLCVIGHKSAGFESVYCPLSQLNIYAGRNSLRVDGPVEASLSSLNLQTPLITPNLLVWKVLCGAGFKLTNHTLLYCCV